MWQSFANLQISLLAVEKLIKQGWTEQQRVCLKSPDCDVLLPLKFRQNCLEVDGHVRALQVFWSAQSLLDPYPPWNSRCWPFWSCFASMNGRDWKVLME